LNPRSPAPQASVLIQTRSTGTRTHDDSPRPDTLTRPRAHTIGIRHEQMLINTLINMKNSGLSKHTLKTTSQKLSQISRNTDLTNPNQVKSYIANHNVSNATKQKLTQSYDYFCKAHDIQWEKPTYRWERKIPLIPTTANSYKIISASSKKYGTIFTILEETGLEGQELATRAHSR
jgi:hypothetical protein